MDQFLHEQHTYTLAQNAQQASDDSVPDEESSWVMLNRDGGIEPLPNERILHQVPGRVGCEISSKEFTDDPSPFSLSSDNGRAFVTNQRVVYLCGKPTEQFSSFSARVLEIGDSDIESPWFGAWRWTAVARPVAGGGIPSHVPRVRIKFTFRDGGHNDFYQAFVLIKERLHHAREMGLDTRRHNIDVEPPPVYVPSTSNATANANASAPNSAEGGEAPAPTSQEQSVSQPPNEPPPDYEEAQAEAVRAGVEDRLRREVDRT